MASFMFVLDFTPPAVPGSSPIQRLNSDPFTAAGFLPDELEELEIYEPKGCDNCTNGYKGRVGLFQLLPLSDTMAELIMKGATEADITRLAEEEGHHNLRQAGLTKMRQGLTSLEEIERVTNN